MTGAPPKNASATICPIPVRNQVRANPAFTAIVVASLALGIGANTAIFSLVDQVLLSRLPAKHPEELVVLAYPFLGQLEAHARPDGVLTSVFGFAPLGTTRQNTTITLDGESSRADVEMNSPSQVQPGMRALANWPAVSALW